MADKVLADGKTLIDLGGGIFAEKVVAVGTTGADIGGSGATPAGEAHIGQVGGHLAVIRVEKTRPADATPYAVNDLINESASAGTSWVFAAPRAGGPGSAVLVNLLLSTNHAANVAAFAVDIYDAAPAVVIFDNAEGTHLYADIGKFLKTITLPALAKATTGSDMAEAEAPCAVLFDAVDGINIYMRLRTLTAFTPVTGSKYTLTASFSQD